MYHHKWYETPREADPEGVNLNHVFRSRAAADRHVEAMTESCRQPGWSGDHLYSTEARNGRPGAWPGADATWAELVPVDCPAGFPAGSAGWLVVRPPFDAAGVCSTELSDDNDTGVRVPLALYPTEAQAAARVAELFRLARRCVNPFAFFHVHWFTGDVLERVRTAWPGAPDQTAGDPDRAASWDAAVPNLDDAARAAVWAETAGRPLFEVRDVRWHAE